MKNVIFIFLVMGLGITLSRFIFIDSYFQIENIEVEGEGTLYAFTTNPEGLHFAGKTVGIVELKEGFKVFSLINASIDELEVGQPVQLEFTAVDLGGERKIILHSFTPIQK